MKQLEVTKLGTTHSCQHLTCHDGCVDKRCVIYVDGEGFGVVFETCGYFFKVAARAAALAANKKYKLSSEMQKRCVPVCWVWGRLDAKLLLLYTSADDDVYSYV